MMTCIAARQNFSLSYNDDCRQRSGVAMGHRGTHLHRLHLVFSPARLRQKKICALELLEVE